MVTFSPPLVPRTDTQQWQEEKAKHETKLLGLRKTVDEAAAVLNLENNEHEVYVSEEQKAKLRLEEVVTRIQTTKDQVKEKSKTLDDLTTKIPTREKELRSSETEIGQVRNHFS